MTDAGDEPDDPGGAAASGADEIADADLFEVRESTIAGLGLGLFAKVPIDDGDGLLEYTGERLTRAEMDARYPGDITALYGVGGLDPEGNEFFIDAVDPATSGLARFINHAPEGIAPNVRFGSLDGRVWVVALRDIEPGEELFVDYGRDYFRGDNAPAKR